MQGCHSGVLITLPPLYDSVQLFRWATCETHLTCDDATLKFWASYVFCTSFIFVSGQDGCSAYLVRIPVAMHMSNVSLR